MRQLCPYWSGGFDWRRKEAVINRFAHFRATIDRFGLHFIHERSQGPDLLPLLILHGWPSSFRQMLKLIPLLLSEAERAFVADAQRWQTTEMAYAMEQSTKPQTLAYGLNNSPAGLAA